MFERFQALMLREWMQHKRGWLITLLVPPLLFLAMVPFGQVEGLPLDRPSAAGVFIMLISGLALMGIALLSSGFQWSGLARRDAQDRSIEFWMSLPGSHSQSIGATLLTHALLMPLAGLAVGYGFGFLIANALVLRGGGAAIWSAMSWASMLSFTLPLLARGLFGVVLMMLWLSPFVLMTMAASAWLKRWGLPVLLVGTIAAGLVLDKLYGITLVWELLQTQSNGASLAMIAQPDAFGAVLREALSPLGQLSSNWVWAAQDALLAIKALASMQFIGGLLVAAGGFALLVLKRSRGG